MSFSRHHFTNHWDGILLINSVKVYRKQRKIFAKLFAIKTCIYAIDEYLIVLVNGTFENNVGIQGIPGGVKKLCGMYAILYIISKYLKKNAAAMMCKRYLKIGVIHAYQTWTMNIYEDIAPHRCAKLRLLNSLKKTKKMEFLWSLDVLFFDEMGQCSVEILATFDIISQKVRNINICFGGVLIIFSVDHTQIQPIRGQPFLASSHVIPCFKMVTLKHYIRSVNYVPFKCIQQIARYKYKILEEEP